MRLLKSGASIPGNILLAEKYWKGEASYKPFWEYLLSYPVKVVAKVN